MEGVLEAELALCARGGRGGKAGGGVGGGQGGRAVGGAVVLVGEGGGEAEDVAGVGRVLRG